MMNAQTEKTVDEQKTYVGFEKKFFTELEQCVIKKKLAQNMSKLLAAKH